MSAALMLWSGYSARAVPVKTESWNRSIYLFLRIILRIEAGSEISPVD